MQRKRPAMTILAFDCACGACSVALWRSGITLAHRAQVQLHGQAEILLPMIQAALAEAGLSYAGLAAIATTLGPGSFTGLRAGLAAARGLALATSLPAIGVTTLEAAAHQVSPSERRGRTIVVAIDTRRDDLFVQMFGEDLNAIVPARVASPADVVSAAPPGALVLSGDATAALAPGLGAAGRDAIVARAAGVIDSRVVAAIAAARLANGASIEPLAPLYLRAPDTTPAKGRLA
jgi:tRNA threonylcarbamoyladenosine biosynthesis protein TsaB